jgi:MFS family permease
VTADHVSLGASQWALTITLLVGAVATPLLGRLGDGRRRRAVILATIAAVLAGCVLSSLPLGYQVLLAGRAVQGVGLSLVPLATAVARDALPAEPSRRTIAAVGITTAAGVGLGYPLAGLLAEYLSLGAAFAAGAILAAVGLVAAAAVLPASPDRHARVDVTGAALLGAGMTGLLLAVAEGPVWGWDSAWVAAVALAGVAAIAAWAAHELRCRHPLVQLRLLRRRPVLAANLSGVLVSLSFYPLMSLVVRYVQTPPAAGYGFGAPAILAGAMLTPFSLASLAASRLAHRLLQRISADMITACGCLAIAAGELIFLTSRSGYPTLVVAMALIGLGVGCVFAVNPVQVATGVPVGETGSAMSFYQLLRTAAYSVASALSASILIAYIPRGDAVPADAGYGAAALASLAVLVLAVVASVAFAARAALRPVSAAAPQTPS